MELIEMHCITKTYHPGKHTVTALDGVDLCIAAGEFAAIVGHSGSGKSTLMHMIGCLDTPDTGEYYLNAKNTAAFSDRQLSEIRGREIGFVFQSFHLLHQLTALENVELPLRYRGFSRESRRLLAEAALEKVGLQNRMRHRPFQLSGGQQQRVAIARAIAASPPILLADEPTGNLDSGAGGEIMALITALWREGTTVVLITHDNGIAAQAQHIIRIADGRVAADRFV